MVGSLLVLAFKTLGKSLRRSAVRDYTEHAPSEGPIFSQDRKGFGNKLSGVKSSNIYTGEKYGMKLCPQGRRTSSRPSRGYLNLRPKVLALPVQVKSPVSGFVFYNAMD